MQNSQVPFSCINSFKKGRVDIVFSRARGCCTLRHPSSVELLPPYLPPNTEEGTEALLAQALCNS